MAQDAVGKVASAPEAFSSSVAVAGTTLTGASLPTGTPRRIEPSFNLTSATNMVRSLRAFGTRVGLQLQGNVLAWAISSRRPELAEWLLDARLNPNAKDSAGMTPLLHAVAAERWEVAARLLAVGADPNEAGPRGVRPIMLASAVGHTPTLDTLLERGADVNALDEAERSPLHYAINARQLPALQRLLAANARISASDGSDLLGVVAETRDWNFIAPILERFDARKWDGYARSLFQEVLRARDVEKLRLLMSKHAGPPALEGRKDPLLAYAAVRNDLETARLLLEAGADPNTAVNTPVEKNLLDFVPHKVLRHYMSNEKGMTTLAIAAGMGNTQMVRLLLQHGAEKNRPTRSKHRLIPLYFAAWGNHTDVLQTLIPNAPSPSEMRIEISLIAQRATLYKHGVPVFRTDISSGQPEFPTPTGSFVITDKKRSHMSSIYKVKMPYFMRLSCKDFGLHEGYVPGYPASHGCIRVPREGAQKLFRDVPIGTLVTIR